MTTRRDDVADDGEYASKKRKIGRACDNCRRRKSRCDGPEGPGSRCLNCEVNNFACTYVGTSTRRAPSKGYVEVLENRLENMENLLRRLLPDGQLPPELASTPSAREREPTDVMPTPTPTTQFLEAQQIESCLTQDPPNRPVGGIRRYGTDFVNLHDLEHEEEDHLAFIEEIKNLDLRHEHRFFGRSSEAMLVKKALDAKQAYTGGAIPRLDYARRRPEFWEPAEWEQFKPDPTPPSYSFPDPDLLDELIDIYFREYNIMWQLFHRPTFTRSVADGLHRSDPGFAQILLLVCAIASRWSNDRRVLSDDIESWHSAGWKWYNQVQFVKRSSLQRPTLYDLQYFSLSIQFLHASSSPQSCWALIGIGVRLAQDAGAHRRKVKNTPLTVEDELWKRAFWVLVSYDRMTSSLCGRPFAIQEDDFDAEPPVECEDEYWENPDPEKAFKQPDGKPSQATAFRLMLNLMQLLAFTHKTVYSLNKQKTALGFTHQWEIHIVIEVDSALNRWMSRLPEYLRWDPKCEDMTFFAQSAILHVHYYYLQILVHRPFIYLPDKKTNVSLPSLAICTNAARSCCNIVDIYRHRTGRHSPFMDVASFTSAIVLLLVMWGSKRSGFPTDMDKGMADVQKCLRALKSGEKRWFHNGRLVDILEALATAGNLPIPAHWHSPSSRRREQSNTPTSLTTMAQAPTADNSAGAQLASASDGNVFYSGDTPPSNSGQSGSEFQANPLFTVPGSFSGSANWDNNQQQQSPPPPPNQQQQPNGWFSSAWDNQSTFGSPMLWFGSVSEANPTFTLPSDFFDNAMSPFSSSSPTQPSQSSQSTQAPQTIPNQAPQTTASPGQTVAFDSDVMAMWSATPSNVILDDWNAYLAELWQLQMDSTQQQQNPRP